jgi:hypothetical protein
VNPAENTAQTAAAGIACCDPPINAWAVEFRVLAAVAATDNLFGPPGKRHRIKRSEPGLQVSWIAAVGLGHCKNQNPKYKIKEVVAAARQLRNFNL